MTIRLLLDATRQAIGPPVVSGLSEQEPPLTSRQKASYRKFRSKGKRRPVGIVASVSRSSPALSRTSQVFRQVRIEPDELRFAIMGYERRFYAFAEPSDLLDRARSDRALASQHLLWISSAWSRAERLGTKLPRQNRDVVEDYLVHLFEAEPARASRRCDLDRRFDQLHYVLSLTRQCLSHPNGLVIESSGLVGDSITLGGFVPTHLDIAICGREVIYHPSAEAVGPYRRIFQVPDVIRYVDAETVRSCSEALASLTEADLRREHDPQAMRKADVYKIRPHDPGPELEEDWAYNYSLFENFRAFYAVAAAHGDGVLVVTS